MTGNRIWVVRWLSVLRISRYFHFLFSSALFPLTSVVGPGLCTLDWLLIGHLLPMLASDWPPLALTNRIQCSDAFQLSRMSRAGASLFRLIIAHPWWLLTFYIFVAHLPLNRPAQFITEITLLSIILVSQLAFPVIRKFDTARDISMNIRPGVWLETEISEHKVAKCNSRRSLCCPRSLVLGGRY